MRQSERGVVWLIQPDWPFGRKHFHASVDAGDEVMRELLMEGDPPKKLGQVGAMFDRVDATYSDALCRTRHPVGVKFPLVMNAKAHRILKRHPERTAVRAFQPQVERPFGSPTADYRCDLRKIAIGG